MGAIVKNYHEYGRCCGSCKYCEFDHGMHLCVHPYELDQNSGPGCWVNAEGVCDWFESCRDDTL